MTPKEKKAFVARMKKGKREAAKGKSKSKGGGKSASKVSLSAKGYSIKYKREHIERTRKNFAYVEYDKGKYYVHTFRENAKPQWFKHAPMTKQEAVKYAAGFNFQNRER